MKKFIVGMALALGAAHVAYGQASAPADPAGHAAHHPAEADQTDGEVRRIDKAAGKITLRHGEIKSLDMPPMTMVFQVKDPALLDGVKPGDKVKFRVVKEGGQIRVTELKPAP
jgi:Cu(I)/Ag(I) efflux system protein CusF